MNFPTRCHGPEVSAFGPHWPCRYSGKGMRIGCDSYPSARGPPFSDKQISASQNLRRPGGHRHRERAAVPGIAERNAELREALEHQTATAEVLGIISRSPTDVQPVLDAIVESAARVCGIDDVLLRLREGNAMVLRAHFGPIPIGRVEISIDEPQFRWMREHGTLHIPDVRAQNDFPMLGSVGAGALCWSFPFVSRGNSLEH